MIIRFTAYVRFTIKNRGCQNVIQKDEYYYLEFSLGINIYLLNVIPPVLTWIPDLSVYRLQQEANNGLQNHLSEKKTKENFTKINTDSHVIERFFLIKCLSLYGGKLTDKRKNNFMLSRVNCISLSRLFKYVS